MGFHTSFDVVYPADPGVVTGARLSTVVKGLLGVCGDGDCWRHISVKFGAAPAKTHRPFFDWLPLSPRIQVPVSDWDLKIQPTSAAQVVDELQAVSGKSIHRALVTIGAIEDGVRSALRRDPGEENSEGLYPYEIDLAVGPIEVPQDEDPHEVLQIGWFSIGISGNGYCFPWTHQEFIDRCLRTHTCDIFRSVLRSVFGAPKANPWVTGLKSCQLRTRLLPDGLIAGVHGI